MTTLPVAAAVLASLPAALKKKRVLLVDASSVSRDLRAETMRKLGMEVDCAADISEARCWWRADLYNLVLIHVELELGPYEKFCQDVRNANPPQQLAFLVGKPAYIAASPNAEACISVQADNVVLGPAMDSPALPGETAARVDQRWGILEASQRISAVRSLSVARSMAVRNRQDPPRDLETRYSKRAADWSELVSEAEKKEETE